MPCGRRTARAAGRARAAARRGRPRRRRSAPPWFAGAPRSSRFRARAPRRRSRSIRGGLPRRRSGCRVALGQLPGRGGQLGEGLGVPVPGAVERLPADDLAVADELAQQRSVVAVVPGWLADADDLRLGDAARRHDGAAPTCGRRPRPCRRSSWPPSSSRPTAPPARDQLVDEAGGRVPAPSPARSRRRSRRPEPSARPAIAYSSRSLVTTIRVPVAPSESSWARTSSAWAIRSPESSRTAPSPGPATSTAVRTAVRDVVGVDQQRRADAQASRPAPGTRRPRCRAAA